MKLQLTVLFSLLSAIVDASESLPFEVSFESLNNASGNVQVNDGDPRFPGWKFDNCWDLNNGKALFVGSTSTTGSFTTPTLDLSGKTRIVLEMKRGGDADAVFTASASNGAEFEIKEFTISNNSDYCTFTLYILNGVPNTTITISGNTGKFYVQRVKVYDMDNSNNNIYDAIFYESFDNVNGTGGNDGSFSPDETVLSKHDCSLFDNYLGATHQSVHLGNKCIYIPSTYYTTPTMNVVPKGQVVLSFEVAGMDNYNFTPNISVSCVNGEISAISNLSVGHEKWNTYYVKVNTMTPSTQFTFNGELCFLDEIKVTAVPSNLNEVKDNMIYITANAAQTLDVQLIRTLTPNIWCPLCLPFDVTQSQMDVATGTTCELRTLTDIRDGVFIFDRVSSVSAGTPFLVKVNALVENPVFEDVTVVNTPAATLTGTAPGYSFVGTYSPVELQTDGTHLFLDTDGELSQPGTDVGYNRMNGLRAYFVVPDASLARVYIPDNTVDINRINHPIVSHRTYDLHGRYVENIHTKGLRIRNGRKYLIP